MGQVTLSSSGLVYIDTQILIYSVENNPVYGTILEPFWIAFDSGEMEVVTSELSLMEALVGPFKTGRDSVVDDYESFFADSGIQLVPITQDILRQAARLRAAANLRTPDAIHAASGLFADCSAFLTNDFVYRKVSGLSPIILDDMAT